MHRLINKKALHDYSIQEKLEAGIVLVGGEVKSIKSGHASLQGGFVQIHNNTLFLTNVHVPEFQPGQGKLFDPDRDRKLLIKKKELTRLIGVMKAQGLTIVPLSLYSKGGFVKVELGIARGKKAYDKRKAIKEREVDRSIRRRLRSKI